MTGQAKLALRPMIGADRMRLVRAGVLPAGREGRDRLEQLRAGGESREPACLLVLSLAESNPGETESEIQVRDGSAIRDRILGLAALYRDPVCPGCAWLAWFMSGNGDKDRNGDDEADADSLRTGFRSLLDLAFNGMDAHRVLVRMTEPGGGALEETALSCGMTRVESGMSRPVAPGCRHRNEILLSLDRAADPQRAIAWIPFSRGWFFLDGTPGAILRAGFRRGGESPGPGRLMESAQRQGILEPDGSLPRPDPDGVGEDRPGAHPGLPDAVARGAAAVRAYFRTRDSNALDGLPIQPEGSPFQQLVWSALSRIPYGETRTYTDIAREVTDGTAGEVRKLTRAVGAACAANPIPLVIPCHRVIGKDGHLVGFSGGLDIKEWLLAHEMFGLD